MLAYSLPIHLLTPYSTLHRYVDTPVNLLLGSLNCTVVAFFDQTWLDVSKLCSHRKRCAGLRVSDPTKMRHPGAVGRVTELGVDHQNVEILINGGLIVGSKTACAGRSSMV